MRFKVRIDGIETTFGLVPSGNQAFQYNTAGNREAHTFPMSLNSWKDSGKSFKMSGCVYEFPDKTGNFIEKTDQNEQP